MSQEVPSERKVPAIVVQQWLESWERVQFGGPLRGKPQPHFYMFSLSALKLRRLAGIHRRVAEQPRAEDYGIQRRHEPERSREIARFVLGGLPWSSVNSMEVAARRFPDLLMPGWLPTAIVGNFVPSGGTRLRNSIAAEDVIRIERDSEGRAWIILPAGIDSAEWQPAVPPFEIIDGQHRLWAFDELGELEGKYELPVVAFDGLDITWQAYLFWTINIKPKRISGSLAFDLYPLLRTQEWLERIEGPSVYREARAQELTEILWRHPQSPWQGRINMLGAPGGGDVTQASFIRSLTASFVKRWEGPGIAIGGLFGGELQNAEVLYWSRVQQAAFLIALWQHVQRAVGGCDDEWAASLRVIAESEGVTKDSDPAFSGRYSLLATDQGVRAVLQVTNDLFYLRAEALELATWSTGDTNDDPTTERVSDVLGSLPGDVLAYLDKMAAVLSAFDWRTSATPGLNTELRLRQAAFRGSGGYRDLRHQLLNALSRSRDGEISGPAETAVRLLGYQ